MAENVPGMEDLPGDIQRKIRSGEIPHNPMWFPAGRRDGLQEVLDAKGEELAAFQQISDEEAESRRLAAVALRRSRRKRRSYLH